MIVVPAAGARTPLPRLVRDPVPILMYHVVAAPPAGAPWPLLYVRPAQFRAQVRALARAGFHAVTLEELFAHWRVGWRLPRKPIVLTFDDGYRSDLTAALPALRRLRWPAVLNLLVANEKPVWGLRPRAVRRLIRAGWEVDAHTLTHRDLTTLAPVDLRHEVAGSRAAIRRRFHVPVLFFCYPSGRFDAQVERAVAAAGYAGATTELPGLARPGDPYALARVRVNGGETGASLVAQLAALGDR